MIRQIIHIDQEKCNGCGACVNACHEGAIGLVNGKAQLMREDYCDGMGDCLPKCPMDAITFEQREAPAYNEAAVQAAKAMKQANVKKHISCPGSKMRDLNYRGMDDEEDPVSAPKAQLRNWPPQIKLCPVKAPYFQEADLLIAADCTAFSYGNFHHDFMRGKITLIGCPKLDSVDYSEKLTEIFRINEIKRITVLRMEVPCCGGLSYAVEKAIQQSGKDIPLQIITLSLDGKIMQE